MILEIEQLESKDDPLDNEKLEKKKKRISRPQAKPTSRSQWVIEGEKPTKYFCTLEHKNYTDKTIKCLKTKNHTVIRNQEEILHKVKIFTHICSSLEMTHWTI